MHYSRLTCTDRAGDVKPYKGKGTRNVPIMKCNDIFLVGHVLDLWMCVCYGGRLVRFVQEMVYSKFITFCLNKCVNTEHGDVYDSVRRLKA